LPAQSVPNVTQVTQCTSDYVKILFTSVNNWYQCLRSCFLTGVLVFRTGVDWC